MWYNVSMSVAQPIESTTTKEFYSSVSPKGQITLPVEVRKQLNIQPKDKVAIRVNHDTVTIAPAPSKLSESFQAVPALPRPLTVEEMAEIATDDHA